MNEEIFQTDEKDGVLWAKGPEGIKFFVVAIARELRARGNKDIRSVFFNQAPKNFSVFLVDGRSFNLPVLEGETLKGAVDRIERAIDWRLIHKKKKKLGVRGKSVKWWQRIVNWIEGKKSNENN